MHRELPDNDAWIARFKDFKVWVDAHEGQMPAEDLNGGPEDTLHAWLKRQRAARADGTLAPTLDAILATVKGAFTAPAPTLQDLLTKAKAAAKEAPGARAAGNTRNSSVEQLEAFYAAHGRLPVFRGTEPNEQKLYSYVIGKLRVRHRRGELDPIIAARLNVIPGVFTGRSYRRREQPAPVSAHAARAKELAARMEDLIAFCSAHGRLPRKTGPAPEPALYGYMYKRVRPAYRTGHLDEVTARRLLALPGVLVPASKTRKPPARREAA